MHHDDAKRAAHQDRRDPSGWGAWHALERLIDSWPLGNDAPPVAPVEGDDEKGPTR